MAVGEALTNLAAAPVQCPVAPARAGVVIAIDVSDEKLAAIGEQCAALTLNAKKLTPRDIKAAIQNFAGRAFRIFAIAPSSAAMTMERV